MGLHVSTPYTLWEKKVLAVLPKVSGSLSAFFSCLIIWTVLRDKKRRGRTYHRLMLGISCCDLSSAIWYGLSTWPMPRGTAIWAAGNDATCNLQGFGVQVSVASSFYNASLSTYYLLVVRFGWKEHQLQTLERWVFHTVPLLWSFVSATVGLSLGVYGNASLWCWATPQYAKFRYTAFYGPLWLMILTVTINTFLVYSHVRKVEKAAHRHRRFVHTPATADPLAKSEGGTSVSKFSLVSRSINISTMILDDGRSSTLQNSFTLQNSISCLENGTVNELEGSFQETQLRRVEAQVRRAEAQRREKQRAMQMQRKSQRTLEVANQCLLYTSAFYLEWSALTATRLIQQINGKTYFPLLVVAAITAPLQGLPNFLVYLLPKLKKHHQEKIWPWLKSFFNSQGFSVTENESTGVGNMPPSQMSVPCYESRPATDIQGRLHVHEEEASGVISDASFEIKKEKKFPLHSEEEHQFDIRAVLEEQEIESDNDDRMSDKNNTVTFALESDEDPAIGCQSMNDGSVGEDSIGLDEALSNDGDVNPDPSSSAVFPFQFS